MDLTRRIAREVTRKQVRQNVRISLVSQTLHRKIDEFDGILINDGLKCILGQLFT